MTQHSLTRSIYVRLLLGIIISVVGVGSLWLLTSFFQLKHATDLLLHQTKQQQRRTQKEHVQIALDLIEHERKRIPEKATDSAQRRTQEAYAMVAELFQQQSQFYPPEMLKELAIAALRNLRHSDGKGYFFAVNLGGVIELYPPKPELEQTNYTAFSSADQRDIIENLIHIARNKGEGSFRYQWPKPNPTGAPTICPKISYIKYFEPLNWLIGTGEYVCDLEAAVQSSLIDQIEKLRFNNDTYIFVTTYDGVSLTYPAKGRNMYDVTDSNGVKIVQEFIELAQGGGGYLEYVMPALAGEKPAAKISYVAPIPGWQWYVGTGDFVADFDEEITLMLAEQKAAMKYKLAALGAALIVFAAIGWLISTRQKQFVASNFKHFQDFFDRCARENIPLDHASQNYTEFKQLALSANLMLEERQRLEQEAKEYHDQLCNIIDSMPSIIAAVDQEGTVIHWNKFAAEKSNISQQQAIGNKIYALLPYIHNLFPEILQHCRDHRHFQHNVSLRDAAALRHISVSAYPLSSSGPEQLVIRIDDITEQAHLEEMMVQTEKMMSIGGLAAGLAHEINNPLSIISQAAQNTRRRLANSLPANQKTAAELGIDLDKLQLYLEQRSIMTFLDNISNAVERSADIIKNMLNFTATSEAKREPCPVSPLVDNAIKMAWNDYDLKKKFNFRQTLVQRNIPDDLPEIIGNRIELEQVFFNLLKNAAQAIAEIKDKTVEPEIRLTAKATADHVIITFKDNGPGISDAVKHRIFEPFFTTKEIGVGTGLGLSVAYFIIVKRHKGQFLVDSAIGQGSTFTIKLPRG